MASHLPSPRSDLADIEPYVSPQMTCRYRMNTNESPYPPPAGLIADVTEELARTQFNRYPDRDATALTHALAKSTGWDAEGIWIANGSNEVLLHLFLAFGGPDRTSVTFEPTYSLHTLIPRIAGTRTRRVDRVPGSWEVPLDSLEKALTGADVVVFCNPNNPTGQVEARASIMRACELTSLVIVDEAYIEFSSQEASVSDLVATYPNLVIARTFSKAWSLAGARLGYLLATPEVVAAMAKVRLPYSLSSFSQAIGIAALTYAGEASGSIEAIKVERHRMIQGLEGLGCEVYRSDANFVLFSPGHGTDARSSTTVWKALYERGVLIRGYPDDPSLKGCLRVTAGTSSETDAFLAALKEVL